MDELLGYPALFDHLRSLGMTEFVERVEPAVRQALSPAANADYERWISVINSLQIPESCQTQLDTDVVRANAAGQSLKSHNATLLRELMPWRKGPFELDGNSIDTEWRSDFKWNRIASAVDWSGTTVLDVGSGNGYFGWRMLGAGAEFVLGLDPYLLYVMQYAAIRKFIGKLPNYVLPVGDGVLTTPLPCFDIVSSMGVLYHRTSPIDHLLALRRSMKPDGTLILETLVVSNEEETALVPVDRYAKMRNVWFLPSLSMLVRWLERCGFRNITHVDTTTTTSEEQRSTDWMTYESLSEFLDANDPTKTVEGYPAPRRCVVTASK